MFLTRLRKYFPNIKEPTPTPSPTATPTPTPTPVNPTVTAQMFVSYKNPYNRNTSFFNTSPAIYSMNYSTYNNSTGIATFQLQNMNPSYYWNGWSLGSQFNIRFAAGYNSMSNPVRVEFLNYDTLCKTVWIVYK